MNLDTFNVVLQKKQMPRFILFVREDLTRYPLSANTLQSLIDAHSTWAKDLSKRGFFIDGNGIPSNGIIVEQKNGDIITSPLRDLKEGLGGYYIIEVENFEAAVAIAKECPTFLEGDKIEVRPLM
jgi:hypothetical protein